MELMMFNIVKFSILLILLNSIFPAYPMDDPRGEQEYIEHWQCGIEGCKNCETSISSHLIHLIAVHPAEVKYSIEDSLYIKEKLGSWLLAKYV